MYVTGMAERLNTKSGVKLGGFRSQMEASYVSSSTEEVLVACLGFMAYQLSI